MAPSASAPSGSLRCATALLLLGCAAHALPQPSSAGGRGGSRSLGSGRGGARYPMDLGPPYGEAWTATVASNMTQIGFDMGLVIVNFTGRCPTPALQNAKTVYGDHYTLLLLCDQGIEYEIAPASRGGGCVKRVIGTADLDPRVCEVCSCPFCIRDTDGQYPNTTWDVRGDIQTIHAGDRTAQAHVWHGHQSDGNDQSHEVSVAFAEDPVTRDLQPFATNISDHLWVTSRAEIQDYREGVPPDAFTVPDICHPTRRPRPAAAAAASAPSLRPRGKAAARGAQHDDELERSALVELATATNLSGWVHSHNWLSDASICDWELVGCDGSGRVKLLTLDFNNLVGTLPESIGHLTKLEDLDLEFNLLTGGIPSALVGLNSSLLQLGLGGNQFSGLVPESLCGMYATAEGSACDLSGSNFSCPLPACFGPRSTSVCSPTCVAAAAAAA